MIMIIAIIYTYPLSNSFEMVTAINPRLRTIADG